MMATFRHRICSGTITTLVNSFVPGRAPRTIRRSLLYLFLAIQCRASAGTRKKNTSTTRSWMKNSRTSLPNSFSSILKKCVVHDAPVFQNSSVAPKYNSAKIRPMINAQKKKFRKKMIFSRSMPRLFTSATPDQSQNDNAHRF